MLKLTSFILFTLFVTVELKSVDENEKVDYRLPNTVYPTKYDIKLRPYIDTEERNFTFDGEVVIHLTVTSPTNKIVLHTNGLNFTYKDVTFLNEDYIQVFTSYDSLRNFTTISTNNKQLEGDYELQIKYVGEINDQLRGFYRSSYISKTGKKVWLATTHFEPVGARLAFPCFDEPHLKATFNLEIIHDKAYSAISNTPGTTELNNAGLKVTKFETTPKMSTYLLAFVVSDFESLTNEYKNFTVYAKPDSYKDGKLALYYGEKLLKKLEEFTGIKFHIKKMDQIAIPDFSAGAMENWGLVTYRESSLLINNKTDIFQEKKVIETIAHEFAHQWFGNLVSPKWWKYIWLNEGFATFFQNYITSLVKPEYRSIELDAVNNVAFLYDSTNATHPINVDVASPSEISDIFDNVVYAKAGAVIRMMQHFLTPEVFQQGLRNYLNKKKESSADSDDLFELMQEVIKNGLNLTRVMDTWINRKGYPVINVKLNENGKVELTQERFVSYNASEEEKNYLWQVPINYATPDKLNFDDTSVDFWLTEKSMTEDLAINPQSWILLNKQRTGFYRVNYDERNWKLLINDLKTKNRTKIHVLNRAQLIEDALEFVKYSKLNVSTLLDLMSFLKNETDYVAWYSGFDVFNWLQMRFKHTLYYPTFKKFVTELLNPLRNSVGFVQKDNDEPMTRMSRRPMVYWFCKISNWDCLNHVKSNFDNWLNGTTEDVSSPDLKELTLCYGLQEASFDDWKKVLYKYNHTNDENEKAIIRESLACSYDETILEYYFNESLKTDGIINNTLIVMNNIIVNSGNGVDFVLDMLNKRIVGLLLKGCTVEKLSKLIESVGMRITTHEQLEKLKQLRNMADVPFSMTEKGIQNAESNLKWLADNEDQLNNWVIDTWVGNGSTTFSASLLLILSSLYFLIFSNNS